jgi:hypothetical protein
MPRGGSLSSFTLPWTDPNSLASIVWEKSFLFFGSKISTRTFSPGRLRYSPPSFWRRSALNRTSCSGRYTGRSVKA